jgi:hypothetical protein
LHETPAFYLGHSRLVWISRLSHWWIYFTPLQTSTGRLRSSSRSYCSNIILKPHFRFICFSVTFTFSTSFLTHLLNHFLRVVSDQTLALVSVSVSLSMGWSTSEICRDSKKRSESQVFEESILSQRILFQPISFTFWLTSQHPNPFSSFDVNTNPWLLSIEAGIHVFS